MSLYDELNGTELDHLGQVIKQKKTPTHLDPTSRNNYRTRSLKTFLWGIVLVAAAAILGLGGVRIVDPDNHPAAAMAILLPALGFLFASLRFFLVGMLGILCGMPFAEFNMWVETQPLYYKVAFLVVGGPLLVLAVTAPIWIAVLLISALHLLK